MAHSLMAKLRKVETDCGAFSPFNILIGQPHFKHFLE